MFLSDFMDPGPSIPLPSRDKPMSSREFATFSMMNNENTSPVMKITQGD
jgi:hypothetical protein